MYNVVGVRFKKAGKIYYFDPADFPLEKDSMLLLRQLRGIEYGKVVVPVKQVEEHDVVFAT